jgi:hypothetical protein
MAFENTHLFVAQSVLSQIKTSEIKKIISENIDYYNLGSIFPDIFSFRKNPTLFNKSTLMHDGKSSNKIFFKALDLTSDDSNLAFLFGYLTHCAADIVVHPIIVYFSGYRETLSNKEKELSGYLHLHFETQIDNKVNNKYYVDQMIKTDVVNDLIMDKVLNISKKEIRTSFRIHKSYFRLFLSRFIYHIFKILCSLSLINKKKLGLFYKNLEYDKTRLPNQLVYQDLFDGHEKTTTINKMMQDSINLSIEKINTTYKYSKGKITKSKLKNI